MKMSVTVHKIQWLKSKVYEDEWYCEDCIDPKTEPKVREKCNRAKLCLRCYSFRMAR